MVVSEQYELWSMMWPGALAAISCVLFARGLTRDQNRDLNAWLRPGMIVLIIAQIEQPEKLLGLSWWALVLILKCALVVWAIRRGAAIARSRHPA